MKTYRNGKGETSVPTDSSSDALGGVLNVLNIVHIFAIGVPS